MPMSHRESDFMFISPAPSKSNIGWQMQIMKARKVLEQGGTVGFYNLEYSPGFEESLIEVLGHDETRSSTSNTNQS